MTIYCYYNTSLKCVKFETQLWSWIKIKVIGLRNDYIDLCWTIIFTAHLLGIAWRVSKIIEHLLFSWLRSVWPWMKVKVDVINTWCILMSEALTVPSLMIVTSTHNNFRGIACEGHTQIDRQTDRQASRQTDRQTGIDRHRQTTETDRQTDRQAGRQTDRHRQTQTDHWDRQTDRQASRQTDRQA